MIIPAKIVHADYYLKSVVFIFVYSLALSSYASINFIPMVFYHIYGNLYNSYACYFRKNLYS